jgi:AMMECR1 domain-containing protein
MTRQEQLRMFTTLKKRMASIRHLRSGAITPEQRSALKAAAVSKAATALSAPRLNPLYDKELHQAPEQSRLAREWAMATEHLK